jgi:hypothetical protein
VIGSNGSVCGPGNIFKFFSIPSKENFRLNKFNLPIEEEAHLLNKELRYIVALRVFE